MAICTAIRRFRTELGRAGLRCVYSQEHWDDYEEPEKCLYLWRTVFSLSTQASQFQLVVPKSLAPVSVLPWPT